METGRPAINELVTMVSPGAQLELAVVSVMSTEKQKTDRKD